VASRLNKNVQHTRTRYEKQLANFHCDQTKVEANVYGWTMAPALAKIIVIKLKEANVYWSTMAPALAKITGDTNADA